MTDVVILNIKKKSRFMTLTLPDYSSPNLQETNPTDLPVAATLMRSPVFWMGFAL